ncbi:succinate dehydrogenase assembly factor 2 [Phaeobacter porticola]|uniref:FAD assembly factor SdhE n=1 Tax=Phaeobacter porticola TaxID=1844006 RepID=A0A1L3I5V6_9RHOB|nr:succinate dehydrogenase assembly factor 2 [Phaeobacter porticola]APG47488.1 hypothetical protein PhaeoP97_02088 [Phaeobacter porticola]
MSELHAHRLKRLHMRSMRRGIKEMDILLSAYAEGALAQMSPANLDLYDDLLQENDQDLYQWVTGQTATPERFAVMVGEIAQTHQKE